VLASNGPQQPTDPLHVLSLTERSPDDDRDVCVRHVDALVEHARAYEGAELAASKGI
jgi:hypothetical protein